MTEAEEIEMAMDMEELMSYNDMDSYQDWTDYTVIYPENKAMEYLILGLASEAGEVAGKLKKSIRDHTELDVDDLMSELGDCLWYIARIAAEQEVFLSEVAKGNIEKLRDRMVRGAIQGSGDNR